METTNVDRGIDAMVDAYTEVISGESRPLRVEVHCHERMRVDIALDNMDEPAKCEFLRSFASAFRRAAWDTQEDRKAAIAQLNVLGVKTAEVLAAMAHECRLLYTLTADGRQFRCWYGRPGSMERDHVDSCGRGLLYSVTGNPTAVHRCVRRILPAYVFNGVLRHPTGTRIYGFND